MNDQTQRPEPELSERVSVAVEAFARGEIVVVADDDDRENEGDLFVAASLCTPEKMAFIIRHTSGIVCAPVAHEEARRLRLDPMVSANDAPLGTAFTVSVDFRHGLTTGISAEERNNTVRGLANSNTGAVDFVRPGHVFPLIAKEGGVLMRSGHTEACVDLCQLAKLPPVGVLAELMNDDGTVMRGRDVQAFAAKHNLKYVSIADLIAYRQSRDKLVERVGEFPIESEIGELKGYAYVTPFEPVYHVACVYGRIGDGRDVPCRLHRANLITDTFGKARPVQAALKRFEEAGRGVIVFLRDGTAGVPVTALPRQNNTASEEARVRQWREIGLGAQILRDLGISSIRLLTTARHRYVGLAGFGIEITDVEPMAFKGFAMLVGVPKEIKDNEYRVGLVPATVHELTAKGHGVLVQAGAGLGAGLTDAEYEAAGAKLVATAEEIFANAELVVKVKEPLANERKLLRRGQILFTYLHLAPDPAQTNDLIESGVTAIAYETVTSPHGGLPLLMPMSEVAGRMAPHVGAHCLEKENGGRGVLLGGVPGVPAASVVILGGGVAGTNAAFIAAGIGADVIVVDRSPEALRRIAAQFGNRVRTLYSTRDGVETACRGADLVIGTVLVPGAAAPKLVSAATVRAMKPGSVIVDVAIDQGGCAETSRPTTHSHPTYVVDDVVHYCVTNMPGAVARTSTFALNNMTMPFVVALADHGLRIALGEDEHLRNGLNVHEGRVTHRAVAGALKLRYAAPQEVLRI